MFPQTDSHYGYGSYRLRIQVTPDQGQSFAIRVPSIQSSSELYVNGRLLANSGQPAPNEHQYTARNVPYSAFFATDGGEIEIVIQTANYLNSSTGGIVRSISFGTAPAVGRRH
ncbi:hypothetical protein LQV63_30945 [Paenibacillus profundus]|uniref:Glycosyl hydrolases family 2 sugar binding domain-containing protein n=1 Tax=Paenibacillus profundus TaxID=1173085 RepID=A0ABS8YTH4_9BACL|nr:hypothetical protein [Paenibacillus profundus]MCE5173647.1 hypothetical protein [Paenibacillus profundus]